MMHKKTDIFLKGLTRIAVGAIIVVLIFVYAQGRPNPSTHNDFIGSTSLSENVTLIYDDLRTETITLPTSISTSAPFTLLLDIGEAQSMPRKSISAYVPYAELTCIADDKVIYAYHVDDDILVSSGGCSTHLIDLPHRLNDPVIRFIYTPRLEGTCTYTILPFTLGRRINIFLGHLLKEDAITLLFSSVLIAMFIIALLFTLVSISKKYYTYDLLYIGFLCLTIGLYLASQLWSFNYLLSDHNLVVYFIEYTALMVITCPVLALLRGKLDPRFNPLMSLGITGSFMNLLIQYALVIFTGREFKEFLSITQIILAVNLVIIIAAFIFTRTQKYPEKRALLISMSPLLINGIIAYITYLIHNILVYTEFLLVGVAIFVGIQTYSFISRFLSLRNEHLKTALYKEMALIDPITGLKNRTAYSQWLRKIEAQKLSLWILSMDLNHLKEINDTYGHQKGDEMIELFSSALKRATRDIHSTQCFRIGGDEFIVLIFEPLQFDISRVVRHIQQHLDALAGDFGIDAFFAFGTHYHDGSGNDTIDDSMYKADQKMYLDKSLYKRSHIRQLHRSHPS